MGHKLARRMLFPLAACFIDRRTGGRVHGLVDIAIEEHLLLWTSWPYRSSDEDRMWDWWSIFQECRLSDGQLECYAALAEGNLQGLMALDLSGKRTGTGKGVIVDYLATNPVNRKTGEGLKCVGIGLMAVALERSIEHGPGGRIWLESLPGAASFMRAWAWPNNPDDRRRGTWFTPSKRRPQNNYLRKSKGRA